MFPLNDFVMEEVEAELKKVEFPPVPRLSIVVGRNSNIWFQPSNTEAICSISCEDDI